ncbi:MAG: cyclic nucleotide-binding domain-containing protein [Rhodoplanes sp.]|uniref:cyclic nucleotide-binding domain-containing protein n=1 Tax=Rhodoplanes sp. TaxID=1968906 RepID=UPI0018271853|nr:cyclic nucleotide-binding domain-containing protein [Rhodoplanes sp.]NVO17766.1 cyclic nucleotide-binding domain-containing protein [Rhodoplanes sp.]
MRKVLYLFGVLTDADIEWMARTGARRRLVDGQVLIREGQDVDALVLLLEGELLVTAEDFGQIARLGVGEIVGEVSLVDSAPASATVTARGDGQALFLDRTTLLEKLDGDPGFGARFYRALAIFLADRLRATRPSRAARLSDDDPVLQDELDVGIMDHVSAAGERFKRMLGIMSSMQ